MDTFLERHKLSKWFILSSFTVVNTELWISNYHFLWGYPISYIHYDMMELMFPSNEVHLIQFSHSVVSDSLRPHEPQHARPPCPSPTPGVHPNPCPLSRWCHPTISSSVVPFSSCPQSFPASGSFPMSQLFAPGGQSIYLLVFSHQFLFSLNKNEEKKKSVGFLS